MAAALHDLLSQNFSEVEPTNKQDDEELLVFGYSCKLFRDDERALFVDQGKHLIPWMGDESHQIDRYDVRGYLSDLRLHESSTNNNQSQYPDWEHWSPEEKRIEQLCEEERYLALYTDLTEEQIYHEEELKRLKAALAEDGAYHEIGFSYDDQEDTSQDDGGALKPNQDERDVEDEPFSVPEGLTVPDNMLLPETMKHHLIIERTAGFVSQHGSQMEIVIKSKQASNPQFNFLAFDSPLNSYYKHLIMAIKTGKYLPKPPEPEIPLKEELSDDEEGSDDDHYLHPSLLGKKEISTPVNIPDLPVFRNSNRNDAYSKLVKNLMEKVGHSREPSPVTIAENTLPPPPMFTSMETYWQHFGGPPGDSPHLVMAYNNQPPPPGDEALYQMFTENVGGEVVYHMLPPPPPPDIQPIIDKMSEYVARSGEDFEMVVKSKRDKRFEFLSPHHEYHQYYLYKKKCHLDVRKQQLERIHKTSDESSGSGRKTSPGTTSNSKNSSSTQPRTGPIAPVCFSIKSKEGAEMSKDKKVFSLVGEMDSEEEGSREEDDEERKEEGDLAAEARNALLDRLVAAAAVAATVPIPAPPPPPPTQEEIQARKILEAKAAEARLVGERLRDKLANAAREKMSQQTKERQLQLERKRKAALFLNMLKSSGALTSCAQSIGARDGQSSKGGGGTPVYGPQMPTDDHNQNGDSAASGSPADDKSPILEYEDDGFRSRHSSPEEVPQPPSRLRLSHGYAQSQQRSSLERPRKTSKHRNNTEGKRSSKSRSRKEHKRHKTPPSSYAFVRRSRSRSTSPKRHRRSRSKDRPHRRYAQGGVVLRVS